MPTGRLKKGKARVAGVTTVEVRRALIRLMDEKDVPTLSQAVGVALEEWMTLTKRVYNSSSPSRSGRGRGGGSGVLNPLADHGGDADE